MNTFAISRTSQLLRGAPSSRTARSVQAISRSPLFASTPLRRPATLFALYQPRRGVASSVSGRPGSQTIGHAALNIKEEVGNSATDAAKVIAGANVRSDVGNQVRQLNSFLGITSSIAHDVPAPVLRFGLLGSLPYLGTSATVIYLARQAGMATTGTISSIDPGVALTILDQALTIQVTYGAVMLSFLGALHWGMEFGGYNGHKGYARLALGALPILIGWPTLALQPTMALIVQWVGFTGLWYADLRATMAGWTPKWYSQYRFYLSILVGTCIIGTLAGISYWGPVAGHGLVSHDLQMLKAERKRRVPGQTGQFAGNIEAVSTGEAGDVYVQVRKKKHEEEEKIDE